LPRFLGLLRLLEILWSVEGAGSAKGQVNTVRQGQGCGEGGAEGRSETYLVRGGGDFLVGECLIPPARALALCIGLVRVGSPVK
jgi:hypothetical protein